MTGLQRWDRVLRAWRRDEETAQRKLVAATGSLRVAQGLLATDVARAQAPARRNGPCDVRELLLDHQSDTHLAEAVALARVAVGQAERLVAQRRAEWSKAALKVAATERLAQRHQDEWLLTAARQEEQLVDDVVTSRWSVRATAGGIGL